MLAVLVWYSTVTIYIAVRGTPDIRQMLRRLAGRTAGENEKGGPAEKSSES